MPVSGWEAERERLRKALTEARLLVDMVACENRPDTKWAKEVRDQVDAALSESKEQTTADGWIEFISHRVQP